jgi:hypothetical protein
MSVIDYGRGKQRRRRPSWLAVLSFVIPIILSLLAWLTYWVYKSPPRASGLDGLGWFFGVLWLFNLLIIGTYFGAPLSIVLALIALLSIHQRPERLVGRTVAVLAILMSVALVVVVGTAHSKVDRAFAQSDASWQNSYKDTVRRMTSEMERLLDACLLYAHAHAGNYPPDIEALRRWIAETNPATVPDVSQYLYFGEGLTDHTVAPSQQVPVYGPDNPLIVWVRRPDAKYVDYFIGTTSGHGERTQSVPSVDLRRYLEACNKERATMGLTPIVENDIFHSGGSPE